MNNLQHERKRSVLPDGGRLRVSLDMMDSVQRQIARPNIVDGNGDNGLALNRPGYRIVTDAYARDEVRRAYWEVEQANINAWRGNDTTGNLRSRPGDKCTCRGREFPDYQGAPGHLDQEGTCVPDDLIEALRLMRGDQAGTQEGPRSSEDDPDTRRRRRRAQYRDPEGREAGSEDEEFEDQIRRAQAARRQATDAAYDAAEQEQRDAYKNWK